MGEQQSIFMYRDEARMGFAVNVVNESADGERHLLYLDGSYESLSSPGYMPSRVTANISEANAQRLMDRLWADGLRPSGVEGGAGVVDAMREHLASKDKHIEDIKHFCSLAMTNTMVVLPERTSEGA